MKIYIHLQAGREITREAEVPYRTVSRYECPDHGFRSWIVTLQPVCLETILIGGVRTLSGIAGSAACNKLGGLGTGVVNREQRNLRESITSLKPSRVLKPGLLDSWPSGTHVGLQAPKNHVLL